jgi:hypothetical protein
MVWSVLTTGSMWSRRGRRRGERDWERWQESWAEGKQNSEVKEKKGEAERWKEKVVAGGRKKAFESRMRRG